MTKPKAKKKIITIFIRLLVCCVVLVASLLLWMTYDDREVLYEPNIELLAPQPEGGDESYLLLLEAFDLSLDEISDELRRSDWIKDNEEDAEEYKQLILSKEEEINKLYEQVTAKLHLWRELAQLAAIGGENGVYSYITTEEIKFTMKMMSKFPAQVAKIIPKLKYEIEKSVNSGESILTDSIDSDLNLELPKKVEKETIYYTKEKQVQVTMIIIRLARLFNYKLQLDSFKQQPLDLEPSILLYQINQKWFPHQRYIVTHFVGLAVESKMLNLWNENFENFDEQNLKALGQLDLQPRTTEQEKHKMIRVAWSEYYFAYKASSSVDWKEILPFWVFPFKNSNKMLNDIVKSNQEFESLLNQYNIEKTYGILRQRVEEQKIDLRNLIDLTGVNIPLTLLKKYKPEKRRSDRKTTEEVRQELIEKLKTN